MRQRWFKMQALDQATLAVEVLIQTELVPEKSQMSHTVGSDKI